MYVLEGEIVLEVEGEEPLPLRAGQSAHHRGEVPHRCRLGGPDGARTLLVIAGS
ncbi:cupin domain-containing protein [Streptomyces sp. H27-S2]|uniref:cupin domain-containing protein n=1 Tax=Streptomyces antarcticus TaxID=2996458 RepID=UPI0022706502|nr:cupin domain-containing protein [Streptomyces sp. H27-S2]MCY0949210.1 cupin domain-containing protein [Streptomyces sp. H27-S2]